MIQRYLVRHLTPIENIRDEATVVLTTDHLAEIAKAENENAALKAQVEHWRDKIRTTGYDGADEIVEGLQQARAELAKAHRMVELYRMSCEQYFTTHKFVDGCGIDNKYCDDCKQFMAIAPTTEAV